MAGTDATREPVTGGPAVILVEPQLGDNIGAAARAMLNCGLTELRLVRPKEGWPNPRALTFAAGALPDLVGVAVFDELGPAIADCAYLLATTARDRDLVKPVLTPRAAAAELRGRIGAGQRCGLLFGPERSGLTNEHLLLADALVTVPLNPAFSSLNLGQAVLLIGYEWFAAGAEPREAWLDDRGSPPATKAEIANLLDRLDAALEAGGFYRVANKHATMRRNLRAIFARAQLTDQEVKSLHGVVTALAEGAGQPAPRPSRRV